MKIEVLDTTLRDGAQAEGVTLSIDDKAECIRLFDDLKIDYIEAGTPFANPKDKKLLCDDDVKTVNSHLVAFGSTRHKNNLTDEDSALNLLSLSKTQFVSVVGKSSVTQAEKVLQVSAQDNLKMIYDSIRFLCDRNKTVFYVTLSMAMSKKVLADIRLNYEKYFYDDLTLAKPSERDKAVVELVVHF